MGLKAIGQRMIQEGPYEVNEARSGEYAFFHREAILARQA
jgi:hypothetical protein